MNAYPISAKQSLRFAVIVALFLTMLPGPIPDAAAQEDDELWSMNFDELMDMEVVSVSKKPQKASDAAAAVFVITAEDIRRSSFTNIPDLLRMVPGLQVAKIDSHRWVVGSRGMNGNGAFNNKLLVLIDGRSVYTPVFAGVYWDEKDYLLEDIARIEVIRGPGATLWGSNAVNGIINIITKNAEETQGAMISGGAGNEELVFGGTRYGDCLSESSCYRVYAKAFDRDDSKSLDATDEYDAWNMIQSGFRVDSRPSEENSFTVSGDFYVGDQQVRLDVPAISPPFTEELRGDTDYYGGNILGRWTHIFSETSDSVLQFYYDRTDREEIFIEQSVDTVDFEFQHTFVPYSGHELIWGLDYRLIHAEADGTFTVSLSDEDMTEHLISGFLQDEITLIDDRLRMILGSKFEHHYISGFEIQPTARLIWNPSDDYSLWTAISRAVRTPSILNEDISVNLRSLPTGTDMPGLLVLQGRDNLEAENLLAYEVGIRGQVHPRLHFDVAVYYNKYDDHITFEPAEPFTNSALNPPTLITPVTFGNHGDVDTYGVELSVDFEAAPWWRMQAGYNFMHIDSDVNADSRDTTLREREGRDPEHQATLRSLMNLPGDLEGDTMIRYVDRLSDLDVDSYIELDARLAWRPLKNLEISINGQNLLDSEHQEFAPIFLQTGIRGIERSIFGKFAWEF